VVQLSVEPTHVEIDLDRVVGREAGLVVAEPGHVEPVAGAEGRHLRNVARSEPVRQVLLGGNRRRITVEDLDLVLSRQLHLLRDVSDRLVEEQDDRGPVPLREVERAHRQVEGLTHALGTQGDDGVVSVGSPSRLHHAGRLGKGLQTGARSAALDVDHDARHLGHAGVAEVLLLEGEARTAGGGHRLGAGQRATDDGPHGRDLVLHLNEPTADPGQACRQSLGDLGGGSDGVAGEEPQAGGKRACGACFIAGHDADVAAVAWRCHVSFLSAGQRTVMAKSGHR